MNRQAIRIGLFYGILQASVSVTFGVLELAASRALWARILTGTVTPIATVVLLGLAGYVTLRRTGSIHDSALAGLAAASVSLVVGLLFQVVLYLVDPRRFTPFLSSFTSSRLPGAAMAVSLALGGICGVALALAIGAVLGALGGWIGRRVARAPVSMLSEP
jgi:hypothetical protein